MSPENLKRIYNEYSAAPDSDPQAKTIYAIMDEAVKHIWEQVVDKGYCPRDAESIAHANLASYFAEHILRRAMKKRKELRQKWRTEFED